jgi:GT2 family glycosyltransferase
MVCSGTGARKLRQVPKVSIITLFHNRWDLTWLYVRQWRAAGPDARDVELVFGDCGSADGSEAIAAEAADVAQVSLFKENLGFSKGNNALARKARGDLLVFLNNDVHLPQGWLEELAAVFAQRPSLGVAGNVQFSVRARAIDHAGIFFDASGRPFHFRPPAAALPGPGFFKVPAVTGACMAVRRNLFEELGGFDEGYRNSYEDVDLCMRAREAGADVGLAARSAIWHYVSASPGRYDSEDANAARFAGRWSEQASRLGQIKPPALDAVDRESGAHPVLVAEEALQVFFPSATGYSEADSSLLLYPRNRSAQIEVPLPAKLDASVFPLRLDPSNGRGRFWISGLSLRRGGETKPFWAVEGPGLGDVCEISGTSRVVPGGPELCIESVGNDPQILVRPPAGLLGRAGRLCLGIRLRSETSETR